ncbi:hypothetical protein [Sphingomonas oligophenolica]|uniref:STAS/SEC14 domain-containing protein n=1 Tax=Sphingomonas oligophenolica TaxID=301154 RepID=A0A502CGC7_9SPHN|nr:hypothetical protein [Sphingomonas oligophenolica]TPG10801.1 hypothetical protein EAH84_12010 [Sphingomonas oligophenolica]
MFEIVFDEAKRVMRLRLTGFWDAATTARFADEVRAESAAAMTRHDSFDVLSDAREFAVQTADVADRFRQLAEQGSARRTAIVMTSALAGMQARRSLAIDRVRVFGDMASAQAWLAEA